MHGISDEDVSERIGYKKFNEKILNILTKLTSQRTGTSLQLLRQHENKNGTIATETIRTHQRDRKNAIQTNLGSEVRVELVREKLQANFYQKKRFWEAKSEQKQVIYRKTSTRPRLRLVTLEYILGEVLQHTP